MKPMPCHKKKHKKRKTSILTSAYPMWKGWKVLSEGYDFSEDPQKVFVNLLIRKLDMCYIALFESRDIIRTIALLKGIILTLSKSSKTSLNKLKENLEKMENGEGRKMLMAEQIYGEITDYLHETYFKETFGVRARNPRPRRLGDNEPANPV